MTIGRHHRAWATPVYLPCPVDGCQRSHPPAWPMCVRHWRVVPVGLRDELCAAHREQRRAPRRYREVYAEAIAAAEDHDSQLAPA